MSKLWTPNSHDTSKNYDRSLDAVERLLSGNRTYHARTTSNKPDYFDDLAKGQSPQVLWIGCADSRVPETTICDCGPGDIFVHRNIANVLWPGDLNSASVIEYAVGFLGVKKVVICGHTKCGGANAALEDGDLGPTLNTWLEPVRELRRKHKKELETLGSADEKANRLAELNVLQSLEHLKEIPVVQKKLAEGVLTLHGAIYDIPNGELKVL